MVVGQKYITSVKLNLALSLIDITIKKQQNEKENKIYNVFSLIDCRSFTRV